MTILGPGCQVCGYGIPQGERRMPAECGFQGYLGKDVSRCLVVVDHRLAAEHHPGTAEQACGWHSDGILPGPDRDLACPAGPQHDGLRPADSAGFRLG